MKKLAIFTIVLMTNLVFAQNNIKQVYKVKKDQEISLKFDFPKLIKITTWKNDEILITGTVNINDGKNNDAFELKESSDAKVFSLEGMIKNHESLPQKVTIKNGSEKLTFASMNDYKLYCKEHNLKPENVNLGTSIEIELEIKIPENYKTNLESVYGLVEITNFDAPLNVKATYGGIDATLKENISGELIVETGFGQIFTNMKIPFDGKNSELFKTHLTANSGQTPKTNLTSQFGNIYLRK